MTDGQPRATFPGRRLLHREFYCLVVLAAAGLLTFLLTRSLAASNDAIRRADALAWYAEGRSALDRDDTSRALEAFRRASHIDRSNRDVSVSLAMALRAAGEDAQAAAVLETLRAEHPDDAEVNLQLARLEADRDALPIAIRYYQDALDALWSPDNADRSRNVRMEFITLLLKQGQRARALSQALVYAAELPPSPDRQLEAGRLFLDVGDPRRALDRYLSVLDAQPGNAVALAGAGEAAFALGDYPRARRYLAQVAPADTRLVSLRTVAELVLSADPLAPRLARAERERRLGQILDYADQRLMSCAVAGGGADVVRERLSRLRERPRPARGRAAPPPEPNARYEDGVELAAQVEQATAACGEPHELGRAVQIIARLRGLEEPR